MQKEFHRKEKKRFLRLSSD